MEKHNNCFRRHGNSFIQIGFVTCFDVTYKVKVKETQNTIATNSCLIDSERIFSVIKVFSYLHKNEKILRNCRFTQIVLPLIQQSNLKFMSSKRTQAKGQKRLSDFQFHLINKKKEKEDKPSESSIKKTRKHLTLLNFPITFSREKNTNRYENTRNENDKVIFEMVRPFNGIIRCLDVNKDQFLGR